MAAAFGAAVAGVSVYKYFDNKYTDLAKPDPDTTGQTVKWTAPDDVWDEIIDSDITRFDYGYRKKTDKPAGERTISVQIESSLLDSYGLILEPRHSPHLVLHRHGEAAADIMDDTADRMGEEDVNVFYIENDKSIDSWVYNIHSPYTYSLFYNADMVNLSMGMRAIGPQKHAYSTGSVDTKQEIQNADDFWAGTNVIFFKSAGNSGSESSGLQRSHAEPYMRADTMAFVGEASVGEDGMISLEPHSSRSGASFAVSNPFFTGYRYPYVRDEELPDVLDDIYDAVPNAYAEYKKSAEDVFKDKLTVQLYAPRAIASLTKAHEDFYNATFEGKDVLQKDPFWQSRNKSDVLEAYQNGIIANADHMRDKFGADERDGVANLYGTSFASPHAGGMFAAMHEKFHDLSEYDLLAAALMAAEPVYYVKKFGSGYDNVPYSFNGKLWHNPGAAGFGYLDPAEFANTVQEMANMLAQNPELKSIERKTGASYVDLTEQVPKPTISTPLDTSEAVSGPRLVNGDPQGVTDTAIPANGDNPETGGPQATDDESSSGNTHEYALEITDDIIALRTNLAIEFKGGMAVAPEYVTLVNPAGGEVKVSPTRLRDGDGSFSLATTDGHFGIETQGVWRIKVPGHIELETARLDISGVERNGLIEQYLARHIEEQDKGTTLDLNKMRPPVGVPKPVKEGFGPF